MKVYFYSGKDNINSYLLINEITKDAIIVDPTNISEHLIFKIEQEHFLLRLALITNPQIEAIVTGLSALKKIYDFDIFCGKEQKKTKHRTDMMQPINKFGSMSIEVFSSKLNCDDICMYKIDNVIFTGMVLLDSFFRGESSFVEKSWINKIREMLFGLDEHIFLFPLSGPPATIKAMKFYSSCM